MVLGPTTTSKFKELETHATPILMGTKKVTVETSQRSALALRLRDAQDVMVEVAKNAPLAMTHAALPMTVMAVDTVVTHPTPPPATIHTITEEIKTHAVIRESQEPLTKGKATPLEFVATLMPTTAMIVTPVQTMTITTRSLANLTTVMIDASITDLSQQEFQKLLRKLLLRQKLMREKVIREKLAKAMIKWTEKWSNMLSN
jgi:hypothetical protein